MLPSRGLASPLIVQLIVGHLSTISRSSILLIHAPQTHRLLRGSPCLETDLVLRIVYTVWMDNMPISLMSFDMPCYVHLAATAE